MESQDDGTSISPTFMDPGYPRFSSSSQHDGAGSTPFGDLKAYCLATYGYDRLPLGPASGVEEASVHPTVNANPEDTTAAGVAPYGHSYPSRSPVGISCPVSLPFIAYASPGPPPSPHHTPGADPKPYQQPSATPEEVSNPSKVLDRAGSQEEELSTVLDRVGGPEEDLVPSSGGTPILNPLQLLGVHPSQALSSPGQAAPISVPAGRSRPTTSPPPLPQAAPNPTTNLTISHGDEGGRIATSANTSAAATTTSADDNTTVTAGNATDSKADTTPSTSTPVLQTLIGTGTRRRNRTALAPLLSSTTDASSSSNANQNNPPVASLTNDVLLDLDAKYRRSLERKARMEQEREAQLEYAKKLRMMKKRVAEKRRRRDLEQAAEMASASPPAQEDDENGPAAGVASTYRLPPSLVPGQDPTPDPSTSTDSSDQENETPNPTDTTPTNEGVENAQAVSEGEPSSPRGSRPTTSPPPPPQAAHNPTTNLTMSHGDEGGCIATSLAAATATIYSAGNSTGVTASDATEGKDDSTPSTSTPTGQVLQTLNGTSTRHRNRTALAPPPSSTTAASSANTNQSNPPVVNHHHPFMQPSHFGSNGVGLPPAPAADGIILPAIPLFLAAPILGPPLRYAPLVNQKVLTKVLLDLEAEHGRFLENQAWMEEKEKKIEYANKVRTMAKRVADKRRRRNSEQAAEVANTSASAPDDNENESATEVASTSSSPPSEQQTEEWTQDNAESSTEETSLVLGQDPTPDPTDSSGGENETRTAPNTTPTNEGALDAQAAAEGEPSSPRGVKRAREEEQEAEPESSQDEDEKRPTRKARPSPTPESEPF
ncbi:hypothetical protein BDN72DRAFT_959554 [Pluteus cervinus]|uniref:Uncharacterized protein n=1 Tax=Pluteus cervinus TaxID=181527 RepID=A0ACD3AVA4_9AGAR|nr:hypothetical protein BDN72DRAFT_959554 [Pluteus cervinus]